MEENKTLLSIVSESDGTMVHINTDNRNEQFQIAVAVYQLLKNSPSIGIMLMEIVAMSKNSDFIQVMEQNTVAMPDFDSILKNTK